MSQKVSLPTDVATTFAARPLNTIFDDSALFADCYSGILSRILSIYDGLFNPFRASALSTWRQSSLLFSAFQFFVGIYQLGNDVQSRLSLPVDEARIQILGQLSSSLSAISSASSPRKTEVLLVISMFGLSSSWYDLDDLGLEHYNAAAALLHAVQDGDSSPRSRQFFQEFLVYWWMMLSFTHKLDSRQLQDPPAIGPRNPLQLRMPHPLTGVSPESQLLLGMVGRLVLAQREMVLRRDMTSTETLLWSLSNIEQARDLKCQLDSLELPAASEVLDPGDPYTPIQDLLNIAEAYRTCGLLLIYRTFPDLVNAEVSVNMDDMANSLPERKDGQKQEYLTSLALGVLQMLEQNSTSSGTRTIEALLLLILSGELRHSGSCGASTTSDVVQVAGPDLHSGAEAYDHSESATRRKVLEARAVVTARFERVKAILPFKTIRRMESLVFETWRLLDDGSRVFWVDLLIKHEWQFLMI